MATEKLAKSHTCTGAQDPPKKSHAVLVNFMRTASSLPSIRRHFGFENRHKDFRAFINKLLPTAEKVQSLAPSNDIHQCNSEYPWQTPQGEIVCPTG